MKSITQRTRWAAPVAGAALTLLVSATAVAAAPDSYPRVYEHDGTEITPADGTLIVSGEFWMEFQPVAGGEDGWWWLRLDGATVRSSGYHVTDATGDREPSTGYLCQDGEYVLVWRDNEGGEFREWTVVATCGSVAATEEPTDAATPTPAPTGDVAPITGTAAPTATPAGDVLGVGGVQAGAGVTPPPTDTTGTTTAASGLLPLVVLALGSLAGAALASAHVAGTRRR